ncbi:MAG: FkbM family methyltransferase [Actinobacteria bacterium]|nr:FkbM family methyltransferase [Actinomycetota bacterium]
MIGKHFIKPYELGGSSTELLCRNIYYNSRMGIATYQRIITSHRNLIRIAGIDDVNTVIDVGANVGFFSLLCRELFPDSIIHAVEPVEEIARCLRNNLGGDANTFFHETAISDEIGTTTMAYDEDCNVVSRVDEKGSIAVTTTTLDRLVDAQNIDQIDLLKIDTETYEAHVLRGAVETLKKTRYLFLEIDLDENPNYTFSSLSRLLFNDDYDFQLVAYRNFADKSEGRIPIMDAVLVNRAIEKIAEHEHAGTTASYPDRHQQ